MEGAEQRGPDPAYPRNHTDTLRGRAWQDLSSGSQRRGCRRGGWCFAANPRCEPQDQDSASGHRNHLDGGERGPVFLQTRTPDKGPLRSLGRLWRYRREAIGPNPGKPRKGSFVASSDCSVQDDARARRSPVASPALKREPSRPRHFLLFHTIVLSQARSCPALRQRARSGTRWGSASACQWSPTSRAYSAAPRRKAARASTPY